MNNIEILNKTDDFLPESSIIEFITQLLKELNCDKWELPITFISSKEIAKLNHQYRDKNSSTDVITFNAFPDGMIPDFDEINPGDIVISLDDVKANCEEFGTSLTEELQRILIHALLHLLGETHQSYNFKEDKMLIKQESLLEMLRERGDVEWHF